MKLNDDGAALPPLARDIVCQIANCRHEDIVDVEPVKFGITNRSFSFRVGRERFILRIPGEGTNLLINRRQEAEVYSTIAPYGLCDAPLYLNPDNGIKISRFLPHVRVCNPNDDSDLQICMDRLRRFHRLALQVGHTFDLFERLEFYEKLRAPAPSHYFDYDETKQRILSLKPWMSANRAPFCLSHIDSVCDNFLFVPAEGGGESVQLTDWEYAGMQDPHVDLAMFCIYSLFTKERSDALIDYYFRGHCPRLIRAKIYGYMAVCGLLWSNWCEYKRMFGITFGSYAEGQYQYAKEFPRHFADARREAGE